MHLLNSVADYQATTQLNTQFYKNSQCIPGLYQIAVSSDNQAVSWLITKASELN
jgi:hypothetical protein